VPKRSTIIAGSVVGGLAIVLVALLVWMKDGPVTGAPDTTSGLIPVPAETSTTPAFDTTPRAPAEKKGGARGGGGRTLPPEPDASKGRVIQQPTTVVRPADLIARARDDIRKGRQFMDQGGYVTADRWFDLAKQRVDSLRERVPGSNDATILDREIAGARTDNRAACRAEQDLERRSNKKTRECP
jgi:hypothetical protein